ncbi:MAG: hypothetical protein MR769_01650 [Campylobacter sp.]|uniref:hypothetical protein n=1 Tax=Campylobacter sp. TaxID=205 RepID=UPI002AA8E29F|nr:hypothetical protein [Campylobacter sp.]MCI6343379.1 hypothetical protein [Campylobacter sp.]MCI7463424.1 hypothetical protein [Campylobacter sp.]
MLSKSDYTPLSDYGAMSDYDKCDELLEEGFPKNSVKHYKFRINYQIKYRT